MLSRSPRQRYGYMHDDTRPPCLSPWYDGVMLALPPKIIGLARNLTKCDSSGPLTLLCLIQYLCYCLNNFLAIMKLFKNNYRGEKYEALSQGGDNEAPNEPTNLCPRRSFFLLSSLCVVLLISNLVLLIQRAHAPSCMERTLYGMVMKVFESGTSLLTS